VTARPTLVAVNRRGLAEVSVVYPAIGCCAASCGTGQRSRRGTASLLRPPPDQPVALRDPARRPRSEAAPSARTDWRTGRREDTAHASRWPSSA